MYFMNDTNSTPAPLYNSETREKTFTRRQIGHCRRCGFTSTREVTIYRRTTTTYGITGVKTRHFEKVTGDMDVACKCNSRNLAFKSIVGRTSETPCDARCTQATGHLCECVCGGKNHGSGH